MSNKRKGEEMNKGIVIMCWSLITAALFGLGFLLGSRQKCEDIWEKPKPVTKWRDTCFVPNHPVLAPLKSKSQ